MLPKKEIKLDKMENVYDDGFAGRTYDSVCLINENVVEQIENVNYVWKLYYTVVQARFFTKIQIFVDFASRYLFEDKVTMFIHIDVNGKEFKKEVVLEKTTGQKFEVELVKIGGKVRNTHIEVVCDIGVSHPKYNAKLIGTESIFTSPDRPHDVILLVEDEKFYVFKQYLATWSKYFNNFFFGDSAEKDKKEFKMEGPHSENFNELMCIIHPSLADSIYDMNVLYIVKFAALFEMPSVMVMCGTYLSDFNKFCWYDLMDRLELSDKYNISHLQVKVLEKLHSMDLVEFNEFLNRHRDRIRDLSYETLKNLI